MRFFVVFSVSCFFTSFGVRCVLFSLRMEGTNDAFGGNVSFPPALFGHIVPFFWDTPCSFLFFCSSRFSFFFWCAFPFFGGFDGAHIVSLILRGLLSFLYTGICFAQFVLIHNEDSRCCFLFGHLSLRICFWVF